MSEPQKAVSVDVEMESGETTGNTTSVESPSSSTPSAPGTTLSAPSTTSVTADVPKKQVRGIENSIYANAPLDNDTEMTSDASASKNHRSRHHRTRPTSTGNQDAGPATQSPVSTPPPQRLQSSQSAAGRQQPAGQQNTFNAGSNSFRGRGRGVMPPSFSTRGGAHHQGFSPRGGANQGFSTRGGGTQGFSTRGGGTQGFSTRGGGTQGFSTRGGASYQGSSTRRGANQGLSSRGGARHQGSSNRNSRRGDASQPIFYGSMNEEQITQVHGKIPAQDTKESGEGSNQGGSVPAASNTNDSAMDGVELSGRPTSTVPQNGGIPAEQEGGVKKPKMTEEELDALIAKKTKEGLSSSRFA